jgi:hypothetical protein
MTSSLLRWWHRFVARWQPSAYEQRGLIVLGGDDVECRQPVESSQPMLEGSRMLAQSRQSGRETR